MSKFTCIHCITLFGRDTKYPIECPFCHEIIGCFYHIKNLKHIKDCKKDKKE
jgi:hypothetical protein